MIKKIPYSVEVVTDEFKEEESIIKIRSQDFSRKRITKRNYHWS